MTARGVHPRSSRSAVHAIAMAPHYGYVCGATENHVHNRSGGATSERDRITCASCLDGVAAGLRGWHLPQVHAQVWVIKCMHTGRYVSCTGWWTYFPADAVTYSSSAEANAAIDRERLPSVFPTRLA